MHLHSTRFVPTNHYVAYSTKESIGWSGVSDGGISSLPSSQSIFPLQNWVGLIIFPLLHSNAITPARSFVITNHEYEHCSLNIWRILFITKKKFFHDVYARTRLITQTQRERDIGEERTRIVLKGCSRVTRKWKDRQISYNSRSNMIKKIKK